MIRISGYYDFPDDTPREMIDKLYEIWALALDLASCDNEITVLEGHVTLQQVNDNAPPPLHHGN